MDKYVIYIYWSDEFEPSYNTLEVESNLDLNLQPPQFLSKWAWRALTSACGYLLRNPENMSGIEVYEQINGKLNKLIFYKFRAK